MKNECVYCGDEVENDYYRDEDGDKMCDNCYGEKYEFSCVGCYDIKEKENNQNHIYITKEMAEEQDIETGIYEIINLPWYVSDYFSMVVIKESLKKILDLPAQFDNHELCDYLCSDCVKKFMEEKNVVFSEKTI